MTTKRDTAIHPHPAAIMIAAIYGEYREFLALRRRGSQDFNTYWCRTALGILPNSDLLGPTAIQDIGQVLRPDIGTSRMPGAYGDLTRPEIARILELDQRLELVVTAASIAEPFFALDVSDTGFQYLVWGPVLGSGEYDPGRRAWEIYYRVYRFYFDAKGELTRIENEARLRYE